MPDATKEFARYWRTPYGRHDLEVQNKQLQDALTQAQKDYDNAKHIAETICNVVERPEAALAAANVLLRAQLLQLLAYFEAVNELSSVTGVPFHGLTLTPQHIRDVLEKPVAASVESEVYDQDGPE